MTPRELALLPLMCAMKLHEAGKIDDDDLLLISNAAYERCLAFPEPGDPK